MRASAAFGHTGRPAALCAPRWVARRETKNVARSAADAVAMSSTLGWPGAHRRAAAPVQQQLALGLLVVRLVDGFVVGVGGGLASRGACSFSAGLMKPAGTACCASASDGLLRL